MTGIPIRSAAAAGSRRWRPVALQALRSAAGTADGVRRYRQQSDRPCAAPDRSRRGNPLSHRSIEEPPRERLGRIMDE